MDTVGFKKTKISPDFTDHQNCVAVLWPFLAFFFLLHPNTVAGFWRVVLRALESGWRVQVFLASGTASQMHKWVMKTIGGGGWEKTAGTEPV